MAKKNKSNMNPIEFYDHKGKECVNKPPVVFVTPEDNGGVAVKIIDDCCFEILNIVEIL